MSDLNLTRRRFLQYAALAGAAIGSSSLLAACDQGDGGEGEQPVADKPALDCTDTSGLSDTDVATRESLGYVELSETEGQNCTNCTHFTPAVAEGECGTCATVAGPINPEGWCTTWVEVET